MIDSLFFSSVSQAKQEARVARDPVRAVGAAGAVSMHGAGETAEDGGGAGRSAQFNAALQSVSEHVQNTQRTLQFSVDKASGSTVVKVIDSETKEVIRQIPSEEMLVIANRLQAATKGVLLSEHA